MSLFDGVENFTPAFEGQRIAIGAGQGAGQSISRGMAISQRSKAQALDESQFDFKKKQYNDTLKRLDDFAARRRQILTGNEDEDYGW